MPAEDDEHLFAGGAPGVLFESHDGGASWELNQAFWEQPTRPEWSPGAGGMCMHSIATWPGDPSKIALAISAVGVWLSDDGGKTWRHGNKGMYPRYMPEEAREETITLCVHNMHRAPKRPERLFMQFHGGVYRSDDAGESWTSIADGLPSDFGFPMVMDPDDPDNAYVIPLVADLDRTTPEGRVRVYETRDAGETWIERGDGLPSNDAYLTILRQAFCREGSGPGDGALLRCDVGRRLRLGRCGEVVVHGRDQPAAGALGPRRLDRLATQPRPQSGRLQGLSRSEAAPGGFRSCGQVQSRPRASIQVGEIRTDTRVSPSRCEAYFSLPVYFCERRSIWSFAPSSTRVVVPVIAIHRYGSPGSTTASDTRGSDVEIARLRAWPGGVEGDAVVVDVHPHDGRVRRSVRPDVVTTPTNGFSRNARS